MLCYREQELLKRRLVLTDDFSWKLIATSSNDEDSVAVNSSGILDQSKLRYVGGVDLSFSKLDESIACAALVVMDLEIMQVVYEDFDTVKLTMPYIAGFLAFREVLSLSLLHITFWMQFVLSLSLHCRSHFLMQFFLCLFTAHHILNAICSLSLLWKSQFEFNLFFLSLFTADHILNATCSLSLFWKSQFECNLSSLSLHCTLYFECNFGLEFLHGLIQFFLLEADSSAPWTSAKDGSQGACFISTSTSPSVGSLSRLELRILCSGVTIRVSFSVLGDCTYQC